MPDMLASNTLGEALPSESDLERRLDALACGECTVDEFVSETINAFSAEQGSHPHLLSRIDRYYQRGQLPAPIFHAIRAQITQQVIECAIDDLPVTIELFPASRSPRAGVSGSPASINPLSGAAGPQDADGTALLASNTSISPGRVLAKRYAVESLLGRGGMGDVFKASDADHPPSADADRHVALKVLRNPIGEYPELLARLRHEFDCTRRLMHPNIVKVYDFVQDESIAFYTMELLEGERLCDLIKRAGRGTLHRAYAWAVIGGVGAALAHAHSRHVIHGDVSPKNVMITRGGELRVLDFGSSRAPGTSGAAGTSESALGVSEGTRPHGQAIVDEETRAIAATPAYASCELLEGHQADPRDDIYSLACLAYELLCGAHPFQGRRSTEARDLKMRATRPPGVTFSQWRALQRGLSWSRNARPAAIREWLADLGLTPEPDRLPPLNGAFRSRPRVPSARLLTQAALPICAVIGIFSVWHMINRRAGDVGPEPAATAATGVPSSAEPGALPAGAPALSDSPSPAGSYPPDRMDSLPAVTPPQPRHSRLANAALAPVRNSTIKFTAHRYAVRPGTSFAEIHLLRSHASKDISNFVWWTEDSSARAGVDFVAQKRASHPFSENSPVATVFVRLLPNLARTQTTSFQVCAGKPSGAALVDVTCSAVVLPAYRG
jgi:serine/threonine protein kinase